MAGDPDAWPARVLSAKRYADPIAAGNKRAFLFVAGWAFQHDEEIRLAVLRPSGLADSHAVLLQLVAEQPRGNLHRGARWSGDADPALRD